VFNWKLSSQPFGVAVGQSKRLVGFW